MSRNPVVKRTVLRWSLSWTKSVLTLCDAEENEGLVSPFAGERATYQAGDLGEARRSDQSGHLVSAAVEASQRDVVSEFAETGSDIVGSLACLEGLRGQLH